MAQSKKNIARWVLQGICVLGILFGFFLLLGAVAMSLGSLGEDSAFLCFGLVLSAIMLVIGAWLARDCYRLLRGRSFEAIRSISAIVALMFLGEVDGLVIGLGNLFTGERRHMGTLLGLAAWLAAVVAAVIVYRICMKLLNRLLKAASGPEEPSETPHPAG